MKTVLLVLLGLLLGVVLILGLLYLTVMAFCSALRVNVLRMQESTPKIRKLHELVEQKTKEGLNPEDLQQDSELRSLQSEIYATFSPHNFVPSFLRAFMPKSWKQAWRYSESFSYINDAIPRIVTNWSVEEFLRRCTIKFMGSAQRSSLEQSFENFLKRFGKLTDYRGVKYYDMDDSISSRKSSRWNFVIEAEFERGTATITGQVLLKGNKFLIDNFYISDAQLGLNK